MHTTNNTIRFLKSLVVIIGVFFTSSCSLLYAAGINTGMSSQVKISLLSGAAPISTVDQLMALPLISIDDMQYIGGFRIKAGTYGESKVGYSLGTMAYNKDAHTLFFNGYVHDQAIAEFYIPELVNSNKILDLNMTTTPKQDFVKILSRVSDRNTQRLDRLGGIEYINGELIAHFYEYYDGNQDNTLTSLVIRDANDLKNSVIDGFFEFEGRAHLILWLSPVPSDLQLLFQGDYITGSSNAMPINGRSSMGPSAFVFKSSDIIGTRKTAGVINTLKVLDYGLTHIIADNEQGWLDFGAWKDVYQYNYLGDPTGGQAFADNYDINMVGANYIWTEDSSAVYGLIIPGTRTYAVFGSSGMHFSGGGYKIVQKNGRLCGGPCSYDPLDKNNYYWFFDLKDLYDVKKGLKLSYEVKPYKYGVFRTPFDDLYDVRKGEPYKGVIRGGTYNAKDGIIYFSMPSVDRAQSRYEAPPIVIAYKVKQ